MSLVNYYRKNKIIPVVNLKDLSQKEIFQQRKSFYNSVNLNESHLKGMSVLELCPGTGINAFYLLNSKIKEITLVDSNPKSIAACKKNLKKFRNRVRIIEKDIFKFNIKKKFDLIVFENVIDGLVNVEPVLKKVSLLLKNNGYLILTYASNESLLSDKLRGLISVVILKNYAEENNIMIKNINFKKKSELVSTFFATHLEKLKTGTRKINKYVQDNLLQTQWLARIRFVPLKKLIASLNTKKGQNVIFWGSSPNIYQDYTWYKKKINLKKINSNIVKNFSNNSLNFIDCRQKYLEGNKQYLKKHIEKIILTITKNISLCAKKKNLTQNQINKVILNLRKLAKLLSKFKNRKNLTVNSINSLITFLKIYLKKGKINNNSLIGFSSWWGHGLAVISFVNQPKQRK